MQESLGFYLFDIFHISWLIATIVLTICGSFFYKKCTQPTRKIIRLILAWFLIIFEMIKNIYLFVHGDLTAAHWPFELCSLAMFATLWHAYYTNKYAGEMLYSLFLPGAIAALLFCNWTERPIFSFMSNFSFIFHIVLIVYIVMTLLAKEIQPTIKNLWAPALLLIIVAPPLYAFNKIFNTNFMFLNTPSPGSPLVPLENLLGNPGYIVGIVGILIVIWIILYTPLIVHAQIVKKRMHRSAK